MTRKLRLANFPDVESLKRFSQSLAMLDATISPEWEFRYYSFDSKWNKDEMMASMRDGSGNDYFILFNRHGAIIKGFAHESKRSLFAGEPPEVWRGILDNVPDEFQSFLSEPAFNIDATTFCLWRRYSDASWQIGDIDYPESDDLDGFESLLWIFDGNPKSYQYFAAEYYEQKISLSAVKHIYAHKPLTDDIISKLNGEILREDLLEDIEEIGYPNVVR